MKTRLLSLIVAAAAALPAAAGPIRTVAVTGAGSVQVVPNLATVNIQITDKGVPAVAPLELQKQNQARVLESLPVIKELVGKSGTVQVIPSLTKVTEYNRQSGEQEFKGYQAMTSIQVTLRGEAAIEKKLGALFDTSKIKADDVTLGDISISERRAAAATRAASAKAMADAQNRAQAQLEKGEKLGSILARGNSAPTYASRAKGGARMAMAMAESVQSDAGSAPVAELGKVSVSVSTGVTYAVKGKAKRLKQ